jgi:uncharacterized coiled-coil DUF342 family protein
MKREINNQLKMLKTSIDWWRNESIKTSFEVEEINTEFEEGTMSEEEVISRLQEVNNKIDYLHRKGVYEQKNLFDFFSTTLK